MLSLIFCLVVVTWLSIPCNALPGILAPQTSGVDYGPSTAAWTPRSTPFVEIVHKRDISLGTSSSISIQPVPTSAMANHALSHGAIAGITVGVFVFVTNLVLQILYYWYRRRSRRLFHLNQTSFIPAEPKATMSQVQITSSVATFFALPDGPQTSERALTSFKDDSIEHRFMALLALFGPSGVPLREFIMLASLRMSTKTSHNHWTIHGERGPLRNAIDAGTTYEECSYLAAFTHEASTVQSVEVFQERLVSWGLINIEYQDLSETHSSAQKCWFMDGRIWRINQSLLSLSSFRPELLSEVFSEVFTEMPCKDISPLAERQREMYYYHAHQAIVHLRQNLDWSLVHRRDMTQVVLVILQLLSHRFQRDDEALLKFAKKNLPQSRLHPDWNMILLVAELKGAIYANCEDLSLIRDRVFEVVEVSVIQAFSSPRAKGLSWWLLVELLDAAEAQDSIELIDAIVQSGKQWLQRLLGSERSSLEQTMLCRALARFGNLDYLEPQPRQYDLLLGYQLSRAGCIERAEELLLSGLEFYASSPISTRLWSYRFELVSLMLRAGRWSEAEAWLASVRKSAITRSQVIHETDFWKRSEECGETFILLGLYQADCDMAMGKLKAAEDCLRNTIERTLFVRDSYIRALRLALRTRLLNVQMWQEIWERATVTAHDLIEDTIASEHCLYTTPYSVSVVVTVLTLINKLLWVNDVPGADRLLKSVKRFEAADYPVLPPDIKLYLERRRAAVSHLLSLEGSAGYIRCLEGSGADSEDAIVFAPVVDQGDRNPHINPSGAHGDTQGTETMPFHSGPDPSKQSSVYQWSSELEHARFPPHEVQELDDLKVQSHEAKVLDTGDNGSAQTARHGAATRRILHLGARTRPVHGGNLLAEKLAQAPHPPTHEPYTVREFERGGSGRERSIPLTVPK